MNWIRKYQLFLFDFDGLLVNTEDLHYQAYINMCAKRGVHLDWDFDRYSEAAHHSATGLRDQIYADFPLLRAQEPDWSVLYDEKKKAFLNLLESGAAQLMPGAAHLIQELDRAKINRCVVTHSAKVIIDMLRKQHGVLNLIPQWITREDYSNPKPDPQCYQIAIDRYAKPGDRIIGFEDSPRGLNALMGTSATPVLICPESYPYVGQIKASNVRYYPSFTSIDDSNYP